MQGTLPGLGNMVTGLALVSWGWVKKYIGHINKTVMMGQRGLIGSSALQISGTCDLVMTVFCT